MCCYQRVQGVSPITPNSGTAQGDFEPVVTNEQEVARSFLQPVKVVLEGVIALEDFAKVSGGSVERFNNASKPV